MGGRDHKKTVLSFCPVTKQWTRLNDLEHNRCSHGAVVVNNVLYLVGGFRDIYIDKYVAASKGFGTIFSIGGGGRRDFGICQYDNDSFIVAGGKKPRYGAKPDQIKTSFIFNTSVNKRKLLGDLKSYKSGLVLVNCLGAVYALGGENNDNNIEKLNPTTNEWEILTITLNIGRYRPCAIAYNEFIYVLGGEIKTYQGIIVENSVEKINTLTGEVKIIESKMLVARSSFAVCRVNSDVFLMGGKIKNPEKSNSYVQTAAMEVFNLESENFTEIAKSPFKNLEFTASVLDIEE